MALPSCKTSYMTGSICETTLESLTSSHFDKEKSTWKNSQERFYGKAWERFGHGPMFSVQMSSQAPPRSPLCDQEENKMDLWRVTFCLPQWSPIFIAQAYSRHVEFWVPLTDYAIWMVTVTKKDGQCWLWSLQLTSQCWPACAPGCLCMWIHNHRDRVQMKNHCR